MQPAKINYKIYQGSTFQETLRWESQTKTYATISAISKSAPCTITTTSAHGLPVGWRFRVVGAGGMKEINSVGEDSFYLATATGMSPQAQAAGDSWLDREQEWIDARNQDAVTVAPTVRSWAGLASYQAYPILQALPPNTTPPVPSNLIPVAGTARTAYLNYQAELALIANTIQINQVNSLGYTTYTSGGVVEYNTPVPLTGYTAQMQIRETLESTTILHELSTGGNGIVINTNDSTIFVTIPAAVTRAFTFDSAVYSLELTNGSGVVMPFASGNLTLVKEVTR